MFSKVSRTIKNFMQTKASDLLANFRGHVRHMFFEALFAIFRILHAYFPEMVELLYRSIPCSYFNLHAVVA